MDGRLINGVCIDGKGRDGGVKKYPPFSDKLQDTKAKLKPKSAQREKRGGRGGRVLLVFDSDGKKVIRCVVLTLWC